MTRLRGWAPRGERLVDKIPQGKWKTATSSPPCATTASRRPACSTRPIATRRALPRLCRTVPRADAQARRRRDPRQSRLPQGKGGAEGDPGGRSPPRLSCRNTPPTSTRSSRSSPSSKLCCERREREPTRSISDACGKILAQYPPADMRRIPQERRIRVDPKAGRSRPCGRILRQMTFLGFRG